MRMDLLAETGIENVDAALLVARSPDNRLQVLLPPIDKMGPDQVVALLLTLVQACINSVEQSAAES